MSYKCVCNYPLVKTYYHAPSGHIYENYICPKCRKYFRKAFIKHLRLFSTFSLKIKNSVVLFNGDVVYFPNESIVVRKVFGKFAVGIWGSDLHFLYPFKTNPPFPLSELK